MSCPATRHFGIIELSEFYSNYGVHSINYDCYYLVSKNATSALTVRHVRFVKTNMTLLNLHDRKCFNTLFFLWNHFKAVSVFYSNFTTSYLREPQLLKTAKKRTRLRFGSANWANSFMYENGNTWVIFPLFALKTPFVVFYRFYLYFFLVEGFVKYLWMLLALWGLGHAGGRWICPWAERSALYFHSFFYNDTLSFL